jgi:hypothetical protein
MRKNRGRGEEEDFGEVDFKAVMSILVILIPVLIFAFNFFQVTIQRVEAPKVGKPKAADVDAEKKLHLTISIDSKGFTIKQNADLVTEQLPFIPKRGNAASDGAGEYDFPKLYSMLRKVKDAYPKETQVNITGDPKIPWHVVARTIDAARLKLKKTTYGSMADYVSAEAPKTVDAKDNDGQAVKLPEPMFDRVVFAVTD